MNKEYYGTICWNGYGGEGDGSETTIADSIESLLGGIEMSLVNHKNKDPFFECASIESNPLDDNRIEITDIIELNLKARRTSGK